MKSPVTASRRYIEHLVAAWEAAFPEAPVRDQHVVLTVPASVDEIARELTVAAAKQAGLSLSAWLVMAANKWLEIERANNEINREFFYDRYPNTENHRRRCPDRKKNRTTNR